MSSHYADEFLSLIILLLLLLLLTLGWLSSISTRMRLMSQLTRYLANEG